MEKLSVDDVAAWMKMFKISPDVIQKFIENEIDGLTLQHLSVIEIDQMVEVMANKVKLRLLISKLKEVF
jgi:hypothetical protein